MSEGADRLWYFAYGSNLDPRTFVGRRRMRPLAIRVGVLHDHRLCFDLPVGPGERAVANLCPQRGDHVWGVLYQIDAAAFDWLDRTEGVHVGAYRRVPIEVRLADEERCAAWTYLSERRRAGRKPSRRYLGLLLAGARHHGLPEDWIAYLRGLELAHDERDPQLPLDLDGR